jgi:hypothetical protein
VVGGAAARLLRTGAAAPELAGALRQLAAAARETPGALAGSAEASRQVAEETAAATQTASTVQREPGDVRAATLIHLVETIGDRLVSAANRR